MFKRWFAERISIHVIFCCLATKIDGTSILTNSGIFCCYGNNLFLKIFNICVWILQAITKHNEIVIGYDINVMIFILE